MYDLIESVLPKLFVRASDILSHVYFRNRILRDTIRETTIQTRSRMDARTYARTPERTNERTQHEKSRAWNSDPDICSTSCIHDF